MYNMKSIIFICFFTLTFYVSGSLSKVQSCYGCTSTSDPVCADPFNTTDAQKFGCPDQKHRSLQTNISNDAKQRTLETPTQITSDTETRCVKVSLIFPNGVTQLIRTCSPITGERKTACQAWEEDYKIGSCQECDKDDCNSGSKLYVTAILFVATSFLHLFH